jgi:thymidylate kinase
MTQLLTPGSLASIIGARPDTARAPWTPGISASTDAPLPPIDVARSELLRRVFDTLDQLKIQYCVTHGYQGLPEAIDSDVDMIVARAQLPTVRQALSSLGGSSRLVQWIDDGACWAAIAAPGEPGRPAIVQLHLSPGFELGNRVFYRDADILSTRRRHRGFWVPAAEVEFACICINRAIKGEFKPEHAAQLAALYEREPAACAQEICRFFAAGSVQQILAGARHKDVACLSAPPLAAPVAPPESNALAASLTRACGKWSRRISRWLRPRNGLHVVFLGPDGVGKSTVIDAVRDALAPAFLRTDYMTFAPSLIPGPLQPKKDTPHQLPPRSLPASLMKAAWWSLCYTIGYFAAVRPAAARASLILNHRYLLDAMVDPKRYRYSGPQFLLKMIWLVAPKPDAIILLDAPTEVIQSRKREVSAAETARQREGYRGLLHGCKNAYLIDTNRPLPIVSDEATEILLGLLSRRASRAAGVGAA